MINDDFNFTLDGSDFPVSIEEFAAYMDGNLSDDEMQRVSSVIAHDDSMQEIMDDMEQSELTLADYGQDEMQLQEIQEEMDFFIPETDPINALAAEDDYDFSSFEQQQTDENDCVDETHSDIDYNEIRHGEDTYGSDFSNGVDYDGHNVF